MLRSVLLQAGLCSVLLLPACAKVEGSGAPARSSHRGSVERVDASPHLSRKSEIRLVVWLTVDQMRGDYLEKYAMQRNEGIGWLLRNGRSYQEVHYGHAITETAPGHATLFTGTSPKEHGIIANQWLLPDGTEVTSVTDEETKLLSTEPAMSESGGGSPRRLLRPTVGDALIEQRGTKARVVSVSAKDRGAILPGGQRGQAYWLGPSGIATSTFYRTALPRWIVEHQRRHPLREYLRDGWPLFRAEQEYQSSPSDLGYTPEEWSPGFPHQVRAGADPYSAVANSPFGDESVMDVALAALKEESLGRDEVPDLLAVSLSSTDKIGHQFGPESRELEDQLFRLDAQVARLVQAVNKLMSPDQFLFVLSSDHGACESVEFLRQSGRPGRRLKKSAVADAVRSLLRREYGHEEYFLGVTTPYVFLARDSIARDGVSLQAVRQQVAKALGEVPGVHLAHVVGEPTPEGALGRRLAEALHAERAGDIYLVPDEATHFLQSDSMAATHGSPWSYDTHVPVILVGPGVLPGVSSGEFDVRSLAPTVAHLAGLKPPAAATAPLLPLGP